tara:strand:- start:13050 stop:13835 length:786 start_codon:yes stop_codon:yes gene_type:complete
MASIADNHLSKFGRNPTGGVKDTEIYKTSPMGPGQGRKWHVNKAEKQIMESQGIRGEEIVDSIGSGTINPHTGLEEKWIPMALQIGGLLLSAGGMLSGRSQQTQAGRINELAAKEEYQAAQSGQVQAIKSLDLLDKSVISERKVYEGEFNKAMQDATRTTENTLMATSEQAEETIGKSNLFQGEAQDRAAETKQMVTEESESNFQNLRANLNKKVGALISSYSQSKQEIKNQIENFARVKRLAKEKANAHYPGKSSDIFTG